MTEKTEKKVSKEDAADKIDRAQQKYHKTDKAKQVKKKYWATPKGKTTRKKYAESEKKKLTQRKYYYSTKGQEGIDRRREKKVNFQRIQKWLEENPGKTYDDAVKELESDEE